MKTKARVVEADGEAERNEQKQQHGELAAGSEANT